MQYATDLVYRETKAMRPLRRRTPRASTMQESRPRPNGYRQFRWMEISPCKAMLWPFRNPLDNFFQQRESSPQILFFDD